METRQRIEGQGITSPVFLTVRPEIEDADSVLHKFGRRTLRSAVSTEMLYLPYLLFRYRVSWTTFGGKAREIVGFLCADLLQGLPMSIPRATRFSVGQDLKDELADFADLLDPPRPKRTVVLERRDVAEDRILPAALSEAAAAERGKAVLRYDLLRLLGGLRFRRIEIVLLPGSKVLYYPFWLVYYRDRQNRMRFDAFDGLSGQKEKGEIARSIKLGMLKKSGKL